MQDATVRVIFVARAVMGGAIWTSHPIWASRLHGPIARPVREATAMHTRYTFHDFTPASGMHESALRGIHPWMASPATALSHGGHPAATCSPSRLRRRLRSRKLRDAVAAAMTAFSDGSSPAAATAASSLFFSDLLPAAAGEEQRREDAVTDTTVAAASGARGRLLSRSAPDESAAGVTDTAFFDATQPIAAAHHHHHHQSSHSAIGLRSPSPSPSPSPSSSRGKPSTAETRDAISEAVKNTTRPPPPPPPPPPASADRDGDTLLLLLVASERTRRSRDRETPVVVVVVVVVHAGAAGRDEESAAEFGRSGGGGAGKRELVSSERGRRIFAVGTPATYPSTVKESKGDDDADESNGNVMVLGNQQKPYTEDTKSLRQNYEPQK
uniref:Uncharacterized protein n=1 Tax=Oryza glumipatula TaxID=40148 RepID=A0A0E0AM76_9ORYZ